MSHQDSSSGPAATNGKRRCEATTAAGTGCQAPPLLDSRHCRVHDPRPEIAAERKEASSRGGRIRKKGIQAAAVAIHDAPTFDPTSPESVIQYRQEIGKLLVSGRLDPSTAKVLLDNAQTAFDTWKEERDLAREDEQRARTDSFFKQKAEEMRAEGEARRAQPRASGDVSDAVAADTSEAPPQSPPAVAGKAAETRDKVVEVGVQVVSTEAPPWGGTTAGKNRKDVGAGGGAVAGDGVPPGADECDRDAGPAGEPVADETPAPLPKPQPRVVYEAAPADTRREQRQAVHEQVRGMVGRWFEGR